MRSADVPQRAEVMTSKEKQLCACLIHAIGCRTKCSPIVISNALFYMHRVYHKFSHAKLKPIDLAITTIFIANKTEDLRVPLSLLIDAAYYIVGSRQTPSRAMYHKIAAKIFSLEGMLLMYLGFQYLEGRHPHFVLAKMEPKGKLAKDLLECAYVISINMLLFTTFCLRYSAEEVAAACVKVAATWMKRDMGCHAEAWLQEFGEGVKFELICEIAEGFITTFNDVDPRIKEEVRATMHKYRLTLNETSTSVERRDARPQVLPPPANVHPSSLTILPSPPAQPHLHPPLLISPPCLQPGVNHSLLPNAPVPPPTRRHPTPILRSPPLPPDYPTSLLQHSLIPPPSPLPLLSPPLPPQNTPPPPPGSPPCNLTFLPQNSSISRPLSPLRSPPLRSPRLPPQSPPCSTKRSSNAPPGPTERDSTSESGAKKPRMDQYHYY
ncbi:unnamed protein product [Rodentolepis nana]|uniref:Cyclin N-terminal domain-containing protein n=1 Tax=Rodentolepis nana TaxID=102285 RepID=A0A0R3TYK4_RODNA|nr:unnamed protein product [Rodentolepis nana]